jgi:hypothetical protein
MSKVDSETYGNLHKEIYTVEIYNRFNLRNSKSIDLLYDLIINANNEITNFKIYSEVDTVIINKSGPININLRTLSNTTLKDKNWYIFNIWPIIGLESTIQSTHGKILGNSDALKTYISDLKSKNKWQIDYFDGYDMPTKAIDLKLAFWNTKSIGYFEYNHIIPLNKLEKISSYKILSR